MQLIRLGDASNFSHGRTSISTVDDAFSGIADASSSTGATSDGEEHDDPPHHPKQLDNVLPSSEAYPQDTIKSEYDDDPLYEEEPAAKRAKHRESAKPAPKQQLKTNKSNKARPTPAPRKNKSTPTVTVDRSMAPPPAKTPTQRAAVDTKLGVGEEDLSSQPRCQRCRKSKKGCDRQRPCGRCRDAGIGVEGCISEDEGNGRKGRYGRHMGVSVKSTGVDTMTEQEYEAASSAAAALVAVDKSKKRKR